MVDELGVVDDDVFPPRVAAAEEAPHLDAQPAPQDVQLADGQPLGGNVRADDELFGESHDEVAPLHVRVEVSKVPDALQPASVGHEPER